MASRTPKYIHFTDTEIDDMIDNFANMLCFVEYDIFYKYISSFHYTDMKTYNFDKMEVLMFLATIIDFIGKKENKLRVRSDLKMNKSQVLSLIFGNMEEYPTFSTNLQFWIAILFDFYFTNHEIFDHIDNMESNYAAMYDTYLVNFDKSQN